MRSAEIETLKAARETRPFLRLTALILALLAAFAWLSGAIDASDFFDERRRANLVRFFTLDAVPPSVADAPEGMRFGAWVSWTRERIADRYLNAAAATLAVAVAAASLAALFGALMAPLTARSVGGRTTRLRTAVSTVMRLFCVIFRAVPEYMLAFLLGALVPSAAWACVLALAIHNGGILGRLYGETLENADHRPVAAWRGAGAAPLAATVGGLFPSVLPRLLTYYFYRLETCVRESTVLGMLGFVSLGHWIVQERAAGRYEEMLLAFAMGALLVLAADLASWVARRVVREAR
ncbi:MAG: ABC transporter permease subunit [Planctomycetota bacterium]